MATRQGFRSTSAPKRLHRRSSPGDSLPFTAGLLCTTTAGSGVHLSLGAVLPAAVAGAVLGAQAGYLIGVKAGPPLLDRPGRPRLQQAVTRARSSLERYGAGKAIVLARFIPLVRTVLNPLAGTVGVPARTFTFWQVLGAQAPGSCCCARRRLPRSRRRRLHCTRSQGTGRSERLHIQHPRLGAR
jgi:membrane protein YqaA with SNARE-associated domain